MCCGRAPDPRWILVSTEDSLGPSQRLRVPRAGREGWRGPCDLGSAPWPGCPEPTTAISSEGTEVAARRDGKEQLHPRPATLRVTAGNRHLMEWGSGPSRRGTRCEVGLLGKASHISVWSWFCSPE